ncbi:hypothetical protein AAHA92_34065 [Salvia divinorum]|uniref:Uncharacterized protein n=1 Tax=Salvia divinorum TaxID=28513 RepID=A0ABD1FHS0_SALDI
MPYFDFEKEVKSKEKAQESSSAKNRGRKPGVFSFGIDFDDVEEYGDATQSNKKLSLQSSNALLRGSTLQKSCSPLKIYGPVGSSSLKSVSVSKLPFGTAHLPDKCKQMTSTLSVKRTLEDGTADTSVLHPAKRLSPQVARSWKDEAEELLAQSKKLNNKKLLMLNIHRIRFLAALRNKIINLGSYFAYEGSSIINDFGEIESVSLF